MIRASHPNVSHEHKCIANIAGRIAGDDEVKFKEQIVADVAWCIVENF